MSPQSIPGQAVPAFRLLGPANRCNATYRPPRTRYSAVSVNTRKFDLAVVGAGLVGASFALAMRGAGLRTALIGPIANPPPGTPDDWDTRVYAISPDSAAFLASLGVWPLVDPSRFQPCLGMDVAGDALGGRIAFSAFEAGVPALAYITESRAIARPMAQLLHDSDVVLVRQPFAGAFQDGTAAWRVQLADGEALDAGLLIGADGGESEVRKAAGLAARVFDYRQQAVVANYRVESSHGGIAFQWFRHPDVLAYLPLPDNCMSMVWSLPAEQALVFAEIPPAQLAERAGAAGHHRLGQLSPLGAQAAFPLQTTRVPAIVGNRVALIGDAAHTVHPLAGLGVNLGFRDAR